MNVRTCVITGYGINADAELQEAFTRAGSEAVRVHIQDIIDQPSLIRDYQVLAFPGGFSFGDHIGSGRVLSHLCKSHLKEGLDAFVSSGKLIIGICNGFQVLVKMGFLPNIGGTWEQEVSLVHNTSGLFQNRWVKVSFSRNSPCVWTKGLPEMELPIRHGEGRFIPASEDILISLKRKNLIALTYKGENPNGSVDSIAGITDQTGRILGLMPHPEAFIVPEHHPRWTREPVAEALGLRLFVNGVSYIQETLWQS